jgi:redox-sensitive bicupin YhaK (pirin superfamily)
MEGAGVKLHRSFGFGETSEFDPFLLFDDFRNERPGDYLAGFPWHPHRGIETITYVLAGTVDHGDSLGNRGSLGAGDVQWMTAGSGILHQEMPKGDPHGSGTFRDASKPLPVQTEHVGVSDDATPSFIGNRSLVLFDSGDEITVTAGDEGIRFLLVSGRPLEEPVAWYGPIVMNTKEELRQAYAELKEGSFIK